MPDYIVKPYDVLFFRGNKSFHFGAWRTEGVFPPYPSTFQGFVRNKILVDKDLINASGKLTDDSQAKKEVGDDEDIKIDITGPYLMDEKKGEVYFKTPADIFRKDKDVNCCDSALRSIGKELETDLEFSLATTEHPKEKLDNLYPPDFISLTELTQYRTSLNNIDIKNKKLFCNEDRVIIGFSEKEKENRKVQDKRFCVTQYKRLRDDIRFLCRVDREINNGTLKFASESHLVSIQKIDDDLIETDLKDSRNTLIDNIFETKAFRMVLLQHGVFKNGWLPFDNVVDGLDLKLLFAFTGQPIKISGYSFVKSQNNKSQSNIELKPIVNAVPAGSVYLFKITNNSTRDAIKNFVEHYDNKKIEHKPYSQIGFNHVILGIGPKEA